jgi:glycosyltransferase involved in cell wall biosynthesis
VPTVLIVCPTFLPHPVVAAHRMSALALELPRRGWKVHVATRWYGHDYHGQAVRASGDGPAIFYLDYNPLTRNGKEPTAVQPAITSKIASHILFPDPSSRSWKRLTEEALAVADECKPDIVLSSSPPHSIHLMAHSLSQELQVPWVADFRDPLVGDIRYYPSRFRFIRRRRLRRMLAGVYQSAAAVVHANRSAPSSQDILRTGRGFYLPNGYPPSLLHFLHQTAPPSDRFRIFASGVTDPQAVVVLVGEGAPHNGRVEIVMAGSSIRPEFNDLPCVRQLGQLSHDEVMWQIASSHAYLCALPRRRSAGLGTSTKLYEFLATGRPVLVVRPGMEDRRLLEQFEAGLIFDSPECLKGAGALGKLALGQGALPHLNLDRFRTMYARERFADNYARLLEGLLRSAAP